MDVLDRIEQASTPQPATWCGDATVTDAAAGTFADGRKKITVDWQGASLDCAYLDSYTPADGDQVTFLKSGSTVYVLGKTAR